MVGVWFYSTLSGRIWVSGNEDYFLEGCMVKTFVLIGDGAKSVFFKKI